MKKFFLALLSAVIISSVGMVNAAEVSDSTLIERQVREEYKNDQQYNLMIKQYGNDYGEIFIQNVVNSKQPKKVLRMGGGSFCYQNVTAIKQTKKYNCGSTTVLQTLYGIGCEENVNGSTDAKKIETIDKEYSVDSQGCLMVYQAIDALNKYSDKTYIYEEASNMSLVEFESNVANSLTYWKPVILHAKTGALKYYNGKNLGHYLSLDQCDRNRSTVRIADCNYDSNYFGYHQVPTKQAYETVHNYASRYLIY